MSFHVEIMQYPPLWGLGGDYGRSGVDTEKMGQRAVSKRSLGVKIGHNPGNAPFFLRRLVLFGVVKFVDFLFDSVEGTVDNCLLIQNSERETLLKVKPGLKMASLGTQKIKNQTKKPKRF